ncbi:SH2 domain-containing protein 1B isoform X2 [Chroicocephalus ridibundus]|uniref:SH2 domain-containing protein 1B isoform X2 n=1 Tax=Chroicocephalus ridibundus TaxID=1192867 RepID=UPI002FDE1387
MEVRTLLLHGTCSGVPGSMLCFTASEQVIHVPSDIQPFLFENLIYTYRIFRERQGYFRIQTSEGVPETIFKTLKDLVYTYEKPNQGLITNLRYPVEKRKSSQRSQRFKSGKDDIYDEIDDSDYITVLP